MFFFLFKTKRVEKERMKYRWIRLPEPEHRDFIPARLSFPSPIWQKGWDLECSFFLFKQINSESNWE